MPQYNGVWTLEAQAQAQSNQQWVTDPNFKNTTLLLQADGTGSGSQNQTFLDGSTNNFYITRNGNATQGSFSPFSQAPGYWSNYFNGASNLTATSNAAYNASTGDFCVEAWVYNTTAASALQVYVLCSGGISLYRTSSGYLEFAKDGVAAYATSSIIVPVNQWSHVVAARSGTTLKLFIDGSQVASVSNSIAFPAGNLAIASTYAGASYHTGYLSNVRYVVGSPVYTAAFTPQTTPLTAITNTVLLTCQSNRFIDNSTTANTLTAGSAPSVQAFGPFAPALQWTPDVVGGSGYFDGTTDWLQTPTSANLAMGSGDITAECWFYPLTSANQQWIFDFRTSGSESTTTLYAYIGDSNGVLYVGFGGFGDQTAGTPIANAWNHVAIVRSGSGSNNVAAFLNGVRTRQLTDTTNLSTSTGVYIGRRYVATVSNQYMAGYIAGSRFVKGTAVYSPSSSTLTLPTIPPTAVTNTQLLLNYTNAGIYDGAMDNVLETVGNAQVATSPVKYGSGSMYFSGVSPYSYLKGNANLGQSAAFGTGDFTVECWVWLTATTSDSVIMDTRPGSNSANYFLFYLWTNSGSQQPTIAWYAPTSYVVSTGTVSAGVWTHIAISRANGILRSFKDGVLQQAAADTTAYANPGAPYPYIGASYGAGSDSFKGYIDDFRISRVARYIANFTPPQQALPRQ